MQSKSVEQVAKTLAQAHIEDDPETTEVWLAESHDEIRLVEVSGSLGATALSEVLPFRFAASPDKGIDYPSVVVLLSLVEWEEVKQGKLSLPEGWNKDTLKRIRTSRPKKLH